MKIEDKTIIIFQLLLAIAVVIITTTLGSQILHLSKEIGEYYDQQEYNISILNIQLSQNINITQGQEILNQTYNEEVNLVSNLTINNG